MLKSVVAQEGNSIRGLLATIPPGAILKNTTDDLTVKKNKYDLVVPAPANPSKDIIYSYLHCV